MAWTEERIIELKQLWAEGQSASKIAEKLGGVTRNAVIGKIHRLGLSNRVDSQDKPAVTKKRGRPSKPKDAEGSISKIAEANKKAVTESNFGNTNIPDGLEDNSDLSNSNHATAETLANVLELEKKSKKLTLMELTERTCKWPIGDPATENFWFCGHPSEQGRPYCSTHIGIAFQPMSVKRERKSK